MTSRAGPRLATAVAATTLALLPVAAGIGLWSTGSTDGLWQSSGALVFCLAFPLLGALVVRRGGADRVGWVMLAISASLAVHRVVQQWAHAALIDRPGALPGGHAAAWVQAWAWLPGWALALTLLPALLPDGRPTGRGRLVARVDAAATVAITLAVAAVSWPLRGPEVLVDNPSDPRVETLNAVGGVGLAVLGVLGVLSLAVLLARFRRAAPDVRRQIAWVVYGAAVAVAAGLAGLFVDAGGLFDALAACAVVGGLGMAVLRRRLYDIDVVVNRTLVYGVLTATLAGSYLAGVLLLQLALSAVTHDSGLAVAGSTLAVAALFRPARARIQALVDRRFYRRRYDARRTLDGFATRVRDEVDLSALEADLRAVVRETLQPAHVSVWLRGPDPRP